MALPPVRLVCGTAGSRYDERDRSCLIFRTAMPGISYPTALSRGLRLRCPRCGEGRLFRQLLAMHRSCGHCGFVYERAPGFFLGSAYLNYGFTVISLTILYVTLHYGFEWSNQAVTVPLVIYF